MRIDCPSCSAQLELNPVDRFARCEYCDSFLRIDLGESLTKTTYQVSLSPSHIPSLLKRALLQHELNEDFRITKLALFYFPFWRFQWKHFSRYGIASSQVARNLKEFAFKTGTQEFFDPKSIENAEIIEPDIFLENALKSIDDLPENADRNEMHPGLIYVPFYKVLFDYGSTNYHVWVAANQRQVIFEDIPASPALVMNQSFAITATIVFAAYTAITFLSIQFTHSLPATLTANVGLTFLLHAWLKRILLK